MGLKLVDRAAPAGDGELIASCIAGDRAAQRALFRREYPRVHASVVRIVGSTRDVDDLVQETFIAVFRALPTFRGDARLSTWIDRIAVRNVFHHLRARKPTVSFDSVADAEAGLHVDEQAHAREGLRRLYAVLAALSPEARAAFALYAIDGRSIADVAAITSTTKIVAKARIWRARREVERAAALDPVLAELVDAAREKGTP